MRNLLIFILSLFILSATAQTAKKCYTPISNYKFQQVYNSVVAKKSESQKLVNAKSVAKNNCLSSEQVKKIASLFENDYNRLAFAELAYLNTTDKSNFYEVYDAFAYFSNVFRLHDYVKGIEQAKNPTVDIVNSDPIFPKYRYPNHINYRGNKGCKSIVSDDMFHKQIREMAKAGSENEKLTLGKNLVSYYCQTTTRIMKMASLLSVESNRLNFAKLGYNRVYDKGNYNYMTQLFKNEFNRRELLKYINSTPFDNNETGCKVTDKQLFNIKNEINKQSFSNTKMTIAKQAVKSNKCFTTSQIIVLLKLFGYDSQKIDLAKYSYDYVTDKENYYKTANLLKYEFDRRSLLEYYKSK